MLLNPTDRYLERKGKREGKREVARKLLDKCFSMDEVIEITGLTREYILKDE